MSKHYNELIRILSSEKRSRAWFKAKVSTGKSIRCACSFHTRKKNLMTKLFRYFFANQSDKNINFRLRFHIGSSVDWFIMCEDFNLVFVCRCGRPWIVSMHRTSPKPKRRNDGSSRRLHVSRHCHRNNFHSMRPWMWLVCSFARLCFSN